MPISRAGTRYGRTSHGTSDRDSFLKKATGALVCTRLKTHGRNRKHCHWGNRILSFCIPVYTAIGIREGRIHSSSTKNRAGWFRGTFSGIFFSPPRFPRKFFVPRNFAVICQLCGNFPEWVWKKRELRIYVRPKICGEQTILVCCSSEFWHFSEFWYQKKKHWKIFHYDETSGVRKSV